MKKVITACASIALMTLSVSNLAYAKHDKENGLPPGLQKKLDRGQGLPPGWQKKVAVGKVLDRDVYDQGIVVASDKKGLVTISIGGKLVKLVKDTREIVGILNGE